MSSFSYSPVNAKLPVVGKKRHEAKVARAGMLIVDARHVVVLARGKKQCRNGKMEAVERENAQNLTGSAFQRRNADIQASVEEIRVRH